MLLSRPHCPRYTLLQVSSNPANLLIQNLMYQNLVYTAVARYLSKKDKSTMDDKRQLMRWYPFPTIAITICDTDIQLHGIVITGTYAQGGHISSRCQPLSDKDSFIKSPDDEGVMAKQAALMHIVRKAAVALDAFFRNPPSLDTLHHSSQLPKYPLPYYVQQLIQDPELVAAGKLLWRGASRASSGGKASGSSSSSSTIQIVALQSEGG